MPRKTKPKLFSAADPEIRPFDAADDLTTPELIEGYLNEAIATGDPQKSPKRPAFSRENLYRAPSDAYAANFGTILRVADALGLTLTFRPKAVKSEIEAAPFQLAKTPLHKVARLVRKPRIKPSKKPVRQAG